MYYKHKLKHHIGPHTHKKRFSSLISPLLSFSLNRIMFLDWEMVPLVNCLLCKNEMWVWTHSTHRKSCVRQFWSVRPEWRPARLANMVGDKFRDCVLKIEEESDRGTPEVDLLPLDGQHIQYFQYFNIFIWKEIEGTCEKYNWATFYRQNFPWLWEPGGTRTHPIVCCDCLNKGHAISPSSTVQGRAWATHSRYCEIPHPFPTILDWNLNLWVKISFYKLLLPQGYKSDEYSIPQVFGTLKVLEVTVEMSTGTVGVSHLPGNFSLAGGAGHCEAVHVAVDLAFCSPDFSPHSERHFTYSIRSSICKNLFKRCHHTYQAKIFAWGRS